MPTVLLVGTFLSRHRGYRAVCEDLAQRLEGRGWEVITTSDKKGRLARVLDMAATVWSRRGTYQAAHVDVYSGTAFVWAEMVCALIRRTGHPYILTLHGGNLPAFARQWPRRVGRLLGSAAAVTVPSRYLLNEMQAYSANLTYLPNALESEDYPYTPRLAARPRLVWLRAFHETYNPTMAPRVLAHLSSDFPDSELVMAGHDKGDGSMERVRRVAEDLGVAHRTRIIGGVKKEDVPGLLNQSDIFLNTTWVDNAPVSVLEAMSCGLCVVSTKVGGVPYLLEDGKDALLTPPGDEGAMAAAIRRILNEPALAATLSRNARAKAEALDWRVILPRWEALFRSLLSAGEPSGQREQQREAAAERQ
jgi:glycosyltransferase involved in cell wall biosynthesis